MVDDDFAKATPRPWWVDVESSPRLQWSIHANAPHGRFTVCPAIANSADDAALIVAAVNAYDRDRALIRELAEALLEAEAVLMIVQPRSNMREYLAALGSVRAALAKVEERE